MSDDDFWVAYKFAYGLIEIMTETKTGLYCSLEVLV